MTWQAGECFNRPGCNQCSHADASYVAKADEYLCEECEAYALKEIEDAENN
jgi:hypothetical protein